MILISFRRTKQYPTIRIEVGTQVILFLKYVTTTIIMTIIETHVSL